jgi:hypothetical protein
MQLLQSGSLRQRKVRCNTTWRSNHRSTGPRGAPCCSYSYHESPKLLRVNPSDNSKGVSEPADTPQDDRKHCARQLERRQRDRDPEPCPRWNARHDGVPVVAHPAPHGRPRRLDRAARGHQDHEGAFAADDEGHRPPLPGGADAGRDLDEALRDRSHLAPRTQSLYCSTISSFPPGCVRSVSGEFAK